MADKKISQLTGATTPLTGTEVLPIVQSSATVKVSADNLWNGRLFKDEFSTGTTAPIAKFGSTDQNRGVWTGVDASGNALIQAYRPSDGNTSTGFNLGIGGKDVKQLSFDGVDVTLSTSNLVQGTAAKGINFTANTPAAGMTSQLLNWYEEGTFTPTYYGSTTAGTTTYTLQSGTYTRIGKVLYYNIRIAWSNATGTGNGTIGGFPYNAQNAYHTAAVLPSDYTLTASNIMSARIGFGNTMDLFQTPVGGGTQTAVGMDAAAELTITGFYLI